jgi:SAM-dependent methyltransferase
MDPLRPEADADATLSELMLRHDAARFDAQAEQFEARAGLPETVCRDVARTVARLGALERGDLVLELGAGTGQLGLRLVELGVRYIGMDASRAMLDEFERRRAGLGDSSIELQLADVDKPWPVAAASVQLVWSSRAAHLFDAAHVVRETRRVARGPGSAFVLGRVQREPDSVQSVLRRRMRELVREHGFAPNDGERRGRELLDALGAFGARRLGPETAAVWVAEQSPRAVIEGWRGKRDLAGAVVPPALQASILAELERFAGARFGSLDVRESSRQRYVLEGALLGEAALA